MVDFDLTKKRKSPNVPKSVVNAFWKAYNYQPKIDPKLVVTDRTSYDAVINKDKLIGFTHVFDKDDGLEKISFKPTTWKHPNQIVFKPENKDVALAWKWFHTNLGFFDSNDEMDFVRGVLLGYPLEQVGIGFLDQVKEKLTDN